MSAKAKRVTDRRKVRYENFDELLAEARSFNSDNSVTVGNWTHGQIYDHLASSFAVSIDGTKNGPRPLRFLLSLLFKKRFLHGAIPAGFNAGNNQPSAIATGAGLANLEQAVARLKSEPARALHPGFGKITVAEWDLFNLRHAELHMSFIAPK